MFDIPRRESELKVEVEKGQVLLFMRPLADETFLRISEEVEIEGADGAVEDMKVLYRTSRVPGLFEDHLIRIEGVTVEGAPFDAENEEHRRHIPQRWKLAANNHLLSYSLGINRKMGKASTPQAGSSPAAETPSPGSPEESADSSKALRGSTSTERPQLTSG